MKSLLSDASSLLKKSSVKQAQQKLMEARVELERGSKSPALLSQIVSVEQEVAARLMKKRVPPEDAELFSSLYLRGLEALQRRDYGAAYQLFLRRLQQAPSDMAAKIRLEECREVLYGRAT